MTLADDYLTQIIDNQQRFLEDANFYAVHIPELPEPPAEVSYGLDHAPWFSFRYDRELIGRIETALTEQGWEKTYEQHEGEVSEYASPRQVWKKRVRIDKYPRDAQVCVQFRDNLDGATCQRKQIGVTTVERPIYEFICKD